MTVTLIPLAIAPLFYGYLLIKISPIVLLKTSLLLLAFSCVIFAQNNSYHVAFIIRFCQGLLLPATFTSITTHIAAQSTEKTLQNNMSIFITGTILGGLFGRILAGIFATYWSWQIFYYLLALALCISAFPLATADTKNHFTFAPLDARSVGNTFTNKGVAKLYISILCLFFCFVAVLNYLPFIVRDLLGNPNEITQGLMYCGFVMGAITSMNAKRLTHRLKSSKKLMLLGYKAFLISIGVLFIQHIAVTFAVLFIFCGAMFLVHSVAAAEVNQRCSSNKNIVNALYVTFYYSGGVLGSYVPGLLYQHFGKYLFLSSLLCVTSIGLMVLLTLKD